MRPATAGVGSCSGRIRAAGNGLVVLVLVIVFVIANAEQLMIATTRRNTSTSTSTIFRPISCFPPRCACEPHAAVAEDTEKVFEGA
jgi:hypothetical protein